jgi:hypothetical protein
MLRAAYQVMTSTQVRAECRTTFIAPAERDVYRDRDLENENLESFSGYKHLAPPGRSHLKHLVQS